MYWSEKRSVLTLVTPPAQEPIGVNDVKAHSRIRHANDDLLIQDKIIGVRQMVEKENDLALITQTWKLSLERFWSEIRIYKWPVQSITSVKYLNAGGTLTTVATTVWEHNLKLRPPLVVLKPNQAWPDVTDTRPGAVEIEFVAGYGDNPEDVPQNIRDYMLIKIADAYEFRESMIPNNLQPNPFIERMLNNDKINSF